MRKLLQNTNAFRVLFVAFAGLFCWLSPTFTHAQDNVSRQRAMDLVKKNSRSIGIETAHISEVIVSRSFKDKILDADMVYLQETYQGIPVYNSIKSVAFKNGQPVSVSGNAFHVASRFKLQKSKQPSLQPFDAIVTAAKYLELKQPAMRKAITTEAGGQKLQFDKLDISQEDITTELLWVKQDNNDVKLAWQVAIHPLKSSDMWLIQVDAVTGKVIGKANLTVSCNWGNDKQAGYEHEGTFENNNEETYSPLAPPPPASISNAAYRVIPYPVESPAYGSFALVNNPWLLAGAGNAAGAFGWHNDGTTDYNVTRGNNVWAKEDHAADDETTIGASATSTTAAPEYSFNFSFDPNTIPATPVNQNAAITNLFYWNNIMHDLTYQYGFDEASGNFQNDNQSLGGVGGDYVLADAQDGSGTSNANFGTPADGSRPRMQMYLFPTTDPNTDLKINTSPSTTGYIQAYEVNMSANNKLHNIGAVTANVVLYDNAANQGCTAAAANAFAGKIVLIARGGTCITYQKTKNAQNAGAVGVIAYMADASGAGYLSSGPDNSITIPGVLITRANGLALISAIQSGTVNATLSGSALDGDLDNGVIAHEYGHGISNRLTGGAANVSCLQNAEQMGEGWSDYYGLMLTTNWATATTADGPNKRTLGNYVLGQNPTGAGIRRYPYSTNLSINKWNYDSLKNGTSGGEPHYVGEIWAATLWDMTWNIIGINGINTNLYNASGAGGNSVAMKLVTQGMKLQPCSPGFIDGRNAILKADTLLYGGRYSCAIWRAFARRGMGKNASEGSSNSVTDQTIDYTLPSFDYDTTVTICNKFTWYDSTYKASGDYSHVIALAGGCTRTVTLHLTILSVASITSQTDAQCFGSATGSITVSPTSGTSPWTYRIGTTSPYVSSNYFPNLKSGKYTVSILDATGCAGITSQVTILQQPSVTSTFAVTNATCYGTSTGALTVTADNGTPPYQYRFGTSGAFGNNNTFNNLRAASYRIYVQDANGCTVNSAAVVTQPTAANLTFTKTDVSCSGKNDGAINLTGAGGTSPYMFRLGTVGGYSSASSFTNLKPGNYRAFVQDANGCAGASVSINIAQSLDPCSPDIPRSAITKAGASVKHLEIILSPNPSASSFTVTTYSPTGAPVEIRVLDVNGKSIYTAKGFPEQSFRFGEAFMSGTYLVEVRQGNEMKTVKAVKIR